MTLSKLWRLVFGRSTTDTRKQSEPARTPEELSAGLLVLKMGSADFMEIEEERREAITRIDRSLASILDAHETKPDGSSREQVCAYCEKLVRLCDEFIAETQAASWLRLNIDFDAQGTRNAYLTAWMKNLPLESPSEGCELVAIVDTETTGLHANDEPITVAILLVEVRMPKGALVRVVEFHQGRREPSVPISSGAKAVHGLSLNDVHGHSFDLLQMERLLRSASIVVAHNAKFDRRMLRHVLTDSDGLPWACSMLTLRKHWDERAGRRSLDAICNALGVDRRSPHNAMTDCEALLKALSAPSGKTARSKSFMALMLERPWCPDGD